jgi:hypothetical protein
LIQFMAEQGMIAREMTAEDLFAPIKETRT